jgi:hypothetical protein
MPRFRVVVFWVVCLGSGFGIVRVAPVAVAAWQLRRQALQVESIRVTADSQGTTGRFPVIEITLRNPAASLSFLTTLDMEVSTRLRRPLIGGCSEGPVQWEYDLLLDGERVAQHDSVIVSQLVDAESLHRFAIAVGQSGPPAHAEYDVTLTVHYNEHSTLPLGRVRLGIDSPACGLAPATRPARPVRVHRTRLPKT